MSNSLSKWQAVNQQLSSEDVAVEGLSSQLAAHNASYDALVLDGGLRQSLMTVRSLGSRGLRVAALETFAGAPAFSSRWCQQAFVCPADAGTQDYLAYLEQLLERTGVRVLITSSDATIA